MAVYVDLLQSRRMRHRRDERGIHLVDGELLCHGYLCSAVDVGPGDSGCSAALRLGTHQT